MPCMVVVDYHHEPHGWWAETCTIPRLSVAGSTYEETRELAEQALHAHLGEDLDIREQLIDDHGNARKVVIINGRPAYLPPPSPATQQDQSIG